MMKYDLPQSHSWGDNTMKNIPVLPLATIFSYLSQFFTVAQSPLPLYTVVKVADGDTIDVSVLLVSLLQKQTNPPGETFLNSF